LPLRGKVASSLIILTVVGSLTAVRAAPLDSTLLAQVARTNLPAAIELCGKAIADNPTNAQPLLWRAELFDRLDRYEDGIRDWTAVAKLLPNSPYIYQRRGELNFKSRRFADSVADFDRVLELDLSQAYRHWQRGISLYYAGKFADGRKQFEVHRLVNSNDVENAAWHFLCAARESGVAKAREIIVPCGPDRRVPMKEIDALYRGSGSPEAVLAAAKRTEGNRADALFYAHLYLGLYFDVMGEATRAREHISKAAGEFGASHYMGHVARIHLAELKRK
jgi:lipoprotein NlpI